MDKQRGSYSRKPQQMLTFNANDYIIVNVGSACGHKGMWLSSIV